MSSRRMNRFIFIVAGCCSVLTGCMKWDYDLGREIAVRPEVGHGLFITNEGNFQYGNATLSFYDTQTRKIDNEVFFRANDQKLGDVAQSLYSKEQARRHEVRPGVTGWAQVNGRNAISWSKKFELDIWYVDHCSFLLDLKIILLTIKKVFVREGINSDDSATMEPFTGTN